MFYFFGNAYFCPANKVQFENRKWEEGKNKLKVKKGLKTAGPDEVEMVKMGKKRGRGVQQLKNASLLIENYEEGKIGWEGGEEKEERKYKLGVQKLKDVAKEERRRREGGVHVSCTW